MHLPNVRNMMLKFKYFTAAEKNRTYADVFLRCLSKVAFLGLPIGDACANVGNI